MGIQLKFNIKFEKLLQSIDGMTPKILWTMGYTNIIAGWRHGTMICEIPE